MFFLSPKEEIDKRLQIGVLKDTETGLTSYTNWSDRLKTNRLENKRYMSHQETT
jgi:hypothetical protein